MLSLGAQGASLYFHFVFKTMRQVGQESRILQSLCGWQAVKGNDSLFVFPVVLFQVASNISAVE